MGLLKNILLAKKLGEKLTFLRASDALRASKKINEMRDKKMFENKNRNKNRNRNKNSNDSGKFLLGAALAAGAGYLFLKNNDKLDDFKDKAEDIKDDLIDTFKGEDIF